jgi:hypothetical protein
MKFLRFVSALLLLALFSSFAFAQDAEPKASKEPVQMAVASPLALTQKPLSIQVRAGRWFPVAVTLTNSGDAVQGVLTLRLSTATGEDRTPTEFFTNVDLPTNSNKRIWLYGRVERDDVDKFEITFNGRGFKAMKAEGVIQNADASTRVVLTISDSDEKLSYLTGLRGAGLGLPGGSNSGEPNFNSTVPSNPNLNSNTTPIRPLGASHDLIPSRWIGFDCVDLVVLQDFPHTSLTPNQISSLRSYAASGGSILVLGGANWQRLSTSPLADLWPVSPQSSGTAASADTSTLINRFARFPVMNGADRLGGAPVVATRGILKSGCRALLGNSSAPLFAVNDFGAGQVLFLAVDPTSPPFLGWRGLPRLWADLFRPTSRPSQIASVGAQDFGNNNYRGGPAYDDPPAQTISGALLEALATSPQLRTPPVSFIAWFLALYVFFLVPVNYVVLRYMDRRELAWVTIPVIVIAFSLMSYAAALRIKGTAILTRQVNLVQGAASVNGNGSKWARADAMLWLFSPRKTTYDISSADPQMVVADYVSDQSTRVAIREPEENQAFALDAAPINMWDWRSFVGHSVADMKGGVRLVTQKNSVGIQNNCGQELKGAVLVSHGRVWAYKNISAGRTGLPDAKYKDTVTEANNQLAGRVENASRFDPQLEPFFSGEAKTPGATATGFATIPNKLLNMALSNQWKVASTFIVAWSDAPVSGMTIGKEGAIAQNLSLLIFRVENDGALRPILARGNASTPDTAARLRLMSIEAITGTAGKSQGAVSIYEAELPSAQITRIELKLSVVLQNEYGYPSAPAVKSNAVAPLRAEIFNFARGAWQRLPLREYDKPKSTPKSATPPGSPRTPPVVNHSPNGNWNLTAMLSGSAAQQCILKPDGRVQIRFTTSHDDAKIQNVQVNAKQ